MTRKEKLEQLASHLEPMIRSGGYVRTFLKGCPIIVTADDTGFRAELTYARDVTHSWQEKSLYKLLQKGVTIHACPFDKTETTDWEGSIQLPFLAHCATRSKKHLITPVSIAVQSTPLCQNCDKELERGKWQYGTLFCCERCSQVAAIIRSARVSLKNGKYPHNPMTKNVIDLRIAFVSFGNGYPTKARKLTEEQRQAIFRRDHSICQMCGKYATDIDHIKGSSSDPSNLRALCKTCNVGRAIAKLPVLTSEQQAIHDDIWKQIRAKKPARPCYDETTWNERWRALSNQYKRYVP